MDGDSSSGRWLLSVRLAVRPDWIRLLTGDDMVLRVRFDGLTAAEANRAARELQDLIARAAGGAVSADLQRERTDTQDFGTSLLLLFGTPAAVMAMRAVHAYIAKRGSRVVIETAEGRVVATGDAATNIDVAGTVAAMRAQQRDG